jgi:hypothetical protein
MKMLLTTGDRELPMAMPLSLTPEDENRSSFRNVVCFFGKPDDGHSPKVQKLSNPN